MAMLSNYSSKLTTSTSGTVIQKVSEAAMLNISWTETLNSFPDLSSYYSDYNSADINTLFDRTFNKAEEAEYRTSVFYGKG